MKRIFTLLLLTISVFSYKTQAQGTACNAEFAVQFINNNTVKFNPVMAVGTPTVAHFWNFGDGSPVNNTVSPTHAYALPGIYAVAHTVVLYNPNGVPQCTQSFTRTVTITAPCNLVVDFSWSTVAASPLTIAFQNLSVPLSNTDSITWNFGDNTSSHDVNPVHTYANAGTYNVCLIVKKNLGPTVSPCIKYICKTVIVQAPPCNLQANYTWTATATNPLRIEFHNTSAPVLPSDSVRWTFGDGTAVNGIMGNPTAANPVHIYAQPGTYTVCLRIKRIVNSTPNPCVSEICKTIVVTSPCNLQANFNWTVTPTNPLRLEFHNTTTPVSVTDSVRWTFGDGTSVNGVQGDPTVANPVHTYNQPGTYTVCLRVKRNNTTGTTPCVSEICKTVVVTTGCNLQAYFISQPDSLHPLRIKFTNMSVPIHPTDSVRWTFGDGTSISGLQSDPNVANPTHIYAQAGTYTVCIRVKKNLNTTPNPCVAEFCKQVVVHPPVCNMQAYFSSQPDPNHPLRIKFTNLTNPILPSDSVRWTFGDGTSVSGLQSDPNVANPTHDYAQAGNYTVCLRVKRNVNTTPVPCVAEFCKQVVVAPPCNIPVDFSWQLDQANPRKVYFTNLTVAPTATATAVWTFGDGTSATTWNAVHEYAQPGRYRVCLKITFGPNCVREKCDSILIPNPPPPCNNQSNFNFVRSTTNSQTFTFIPVYQNSSTQYTWTFGDGTGSQSMIATHQYAQPGTYTACLTVWRGPNCASTTCKTIQVTQQINCDSVHVTYNYQPDPQIPNKIHFYASSNYPILDQTWTIKRLNGPAGIPNVVLHQNNPTYLFQDTGYYDVCLRAVTLGGCVKEFCRVIHITQVSNACVLQAFPNPASSVVNVNVTLAQPQMIHAYMYNNQGVLVREKHQQGVSGLNLVKFELNGLPAGSYTIKLIYGNHVCYAPFQKL